MQSQIITGERLSSWNLNLITKIILIIFTTVNNGPNLAHCFLIAYSDLEKRKHKNLLEHYAGARANIEQKPYRASSTCKWDEGGHAYRGVMSNVSITKLFTLLLYTLILI